MADKYLIPNATGGLTQVEATVASSGAGDAGKILGLDASGRLDGSVMPIGIGADTASIQASENLSAGDFVEVWNSAGSFRVRKADGATGKAASGFVLSAVSSGANASVYFEGTNTAVTGATAGVVYLSVTTPGGFQSAAPTVAGQTLQVVGFAVSATAINFERGTPILRA